MYYDEAGCQDQRDSIYIQIYQDYIQKIRTLHAILNFLKEIAIILPKKGECDNCTFIGIRHRVIPFLQTENQPSLSLSLSLYLSLSPLV